LVEVSNKKQVIVTARVDKELRQEFRSLLMKKGVTVQDYIAEHIENYVKEHGSSSPDAEITRTIESTKRGAKPRKEKLAEIAASKEE
jgi:antitoxin component of RelBE/YafQ-DinJ toxin-antitoxin module